MEIKEIDTYTDKTHIDKVHIDKVHINKTPTKEEVLKKYFGYDSFRRGQEDIINAILSGRDSLSIMPTGAGKSLCYQVPAMILPGITLVISPLISLMQDQVKALNQAGIHAAYINSSLSEAQIMKALNLARMGYYKIIYVAPERLMNEDFLWFATGSEISMVTVDEAHCISQWGQDFRPSYMKILDFIKELPKRPVVSAFTATATEEVKTDILFTLDLRDPLVTLTGFNRENLYFSVEHIRRKDDFVVDYVRKHSDQSGIIYCATRKNTDKLTELLDAEGISVTAYHAGLGSLERKRNQDDFIYDRKQVVVATNAFGMGIDKSNVRYVIHYNMPQSMENYYQEAGRAGRDGEPSECILLFSPQDVMIDRMLLDHKDFSEMDQETEADLRSRDLHRLRVMENYCNTSGCLRSLILNYFGEETDGPCGNCGNCSREFREIDVTDEAKQIINCVFESRGRYGIGVIVGTLTGANRAKLREYRTTDYRTYGILSDCPEARIREIIEMLKEEGYLHQTEDRYSLLQIGQGLSRLKDPETHIYLRIAEPTESERRNQQALKDGICGGMYDEKYGGKHSGKNGGKHAAASDSLTSLGFSLFARLKDLRTLIAREESVPPYIIFSDKTLIYLCINAPSDRAEMLAVNGVGEHKFEKYGARFLDAIRSFREENPGILAILPEEDPAAKGRKNFSGDTSETSSDGFSDGFSAGPGPLTSRSGSRKKQPKVDFYLTPEQASQFEAKPLCEPAELKDMLNALSDGEIVKKVTIKSFTQYLLEAGLLQEITEGRITNYLPTEQGYAAGLQTETKTAQSGREYQVLRYTDRMQLMILQHFISMGETPASIGGGRS